MFCPNLIAFSRFLTDFSYQPGISIQGDVTPARRLDALRIDSLVPVEPAGDPSNCVGGGRPYSAVDGVASAQYGRYLFAVGSKPEAAYATGAPVS